MLVPSEKTIAILERLAALREHNGSTTALRTVIGSVLDTLAARLAAEVNSTGKSTAASRVTAVTGVVEILE